MIYYEVILVKQALTPISENTYGELYGPILGYRPYFWILSLLLFFGSLFILIKNKLNKNK